MILDYKKGTLGVNLNKFLPAKKSELKVLLKTTELCDNAEDLRKGKMVS